MAKKQINKAMLEKLSKNAEMTENEKELGGIKNFTIAFKFSEYMKIKTHCEEHHISIGKFIKSLIEKEGII
ncbi:hypothetical protein K8T27_001704 [Campylobacter upsaliensis]|uniref:Uncharacterized protein n=1 Tax=Campylobacter upsaliensis TaxID=28080 RepID=A0A5L4JZ39_CAMUP|nr:hypothetical protein [Campylobacter upsaliensis]EAH5904549.1 hypothetical protein [Campylobacter upsaliensis]EAH7598103.1 hypothetical protein [Campylobacter upsaliensis]EAH9988122.1 hypothetical protein [Campylobacter upsaliensis]EAI0687985.1 hypothetical protein [Campylobacter upsaliensis]EAI2901492.1 hypothetical protein [Campylobacter upsaliensis]